MPKPNIVVTNNQDMTQAQQERLESLGNVTWYDEPPETAKEYLKRIEGADVICSGTAGLQHAYKSLRDVYVTVGFVSVAFVDAELMRKNNVPLSNAPGINRHAVSEWIIAMLLLLMRNNFGGLNRQETYRLDGALPPLTPGLAGRNITILGKGNIGARVGEVATALDMKVTYFQRGNDLHSAVKDADVVVDTLSDNPSTNKILNDNFFAAMKPGSRFITITRSSVVDEKALMKHLDSGHLAGAATDCGGIDVGDTTDPLYKKVSVHPKILATPHISYSTEMSMQYGNDVMIDNVESYINGNPHNLVN